MATALLVVAAGAAVADWIAVARGAKTLEYVTKPLAMAALVGVAVAVTPEDPTRRLWFVCAGVFSLAGDVFLMLPKDRFVAGLASFLVAHLCYIAGLLTGGLALTGAAAAAVVVIVTVAMVGLPVLAAVRTRHRALSLPVVVYLVVISVMVVAAGASGPVLALAGALLFYASDSVLAWRRFVTPVAWAPVVVMVTYHLGQAALLASLALR